MSKQVAWLPAIFLIGVTSSCGSPARVAGTTSPAPVLITEIPIPLSETPVQTHTPRVPTSTPSPLPVETPTSQLELHSRTPSLQQLNDYLKSKIADFKGFDPDLDPALKQLTLEDVSGDGRPDLVAQAYYSDDDMNLAIVYEDLNGDAEDELIVYSYHGLFIFLWDGHAYRSPFYLLSEWATLASKYGFQSKVDFRDWTKDGLPEVVYDQTSRSGGPGFVTSITTRSLVHCQPTLCQLAWQGELSNLADDHNSGGTRQSTADMRAVSDVAEQPALRLFDQGFQIDCCRDSSLTGLAGLYIYTATVSIYAWNGDAFTLSKQEIASRESFIASHAQLTAKNSFGYQASLARAPSNLPANSYCQLIIENQVANPSFPCRLNFATVEWKDITDDGQEEVVVIAYSGSYPVRPDGQQSYETCSHQRLLAYQWDGSQAIEIANVAGCVIRKDLYGVKLEDYDQDGQVEILAAHFHVFGDQPLNSRAYKWNGNKFVLWSDIPE